MIQLYSVTFHQGFKGRRIWVSKAAKINNSIQCLNTMFDLKVVNVKLSLKLYPICYSEVLDKTSNLPRNQRTNFVVVFKNYTYTIFKPSPKTGWPLKYFCFES